MVKSDDFLLQLLWIRDYDSTLGLPFWPFVPISKSILIVRSDNETLSSLIFFSVLLVLFYNLVSTINRNQVIGKFMQLGISTSLFLMLIQGQIKYYIFPTYQYLSLFVALTSSLLFLKFRSSTTNGRIWVFSLLTVFTLFVRFPQSLLVLLAFIATLAHSKKAKGIQRKTAIFRYVLVNIFILVLLSFFDFRQIENLVDYIADSFVFSSMPLERPFTNILYTSLITVFPHMNSIFRMRQRKFIFATIILVVGYNFLYFRFNYEFFENTTIALCFLMLAVRLNPPLQVLKIALFLNVLVSSFLFGSYNAIRDFQSTQISLFSLTILFYYLSRQNENVIGPHSQKVVLFRRIVFPTVFLLILTLQFHDINRTDVLASVDTGFIGTESKTTLFLDLSSRQDSWLLVRDNNWVVFPYVIPAIFPSRKLGEQRVLAITNEVLEKRAKRVLGILKRVDTVDNFKILIEGELLDKDSRYEMSQYSSSLLTLLKFDTKLCETGEKLNQINLPRQTLIVEACS